MRKNLDKDAPKVYTVGGFRVDLLGEESEKMVQTQLVKLPKGGRGIRVTVRSLLTRYDMVAAVVHARREGEGNITKSVAARYLRNILEENGVEGFIRILNSATERERNESDDTVAMLFPNL